jgi:hypothetical protein
MKGTMRIAINVLYFAFLLFTAVWAFTEPNSFWNSAAFAGITAIFGLLWIAFLGWAGHWLWQRFGASG